MIHQIQLAGNSEKKNSKFDKHYSVTSTHQNQIRNLILSGGGWFRTASLLLLTITDHYTDQIGLKTGGNLLDYEITFMHIIAGLSTIPSDGTIKVCL